TPDRAVAELRRPGGHCDRERAAVGRSAGEDPRPHGLARTADGDLGSVADHQLISWGSRAGVPENARERRARLRSTLWHDGYVEWRKFPQRSGLQRPDRVRGFATKSSYPSPSRKR